jgi:hypothetical protein
MKKCVCKYNNKKTNSVYLFYIIKININSSNNNNIKITNQNVFIRRKKNKYAKDNRLW